MRGFFSIVNRLKPSRSIIPARMDVPLKPSMIYLSKMPIEAPTPVPTGHYPYQSFGLFKTSGPKLIHPALIEIFLIGGQFIFETLADSYIDKKTEIKILNRKVQNLFLNLLTFTKNECSLKELLMPYLKEEQLIDSNLKNNDWLVRHVSPVITFKIIYNFIIDDEKLSESVDKEQLISILKLLKDGLSTLATVYNSTYELGIKKGVYDEISFTPLDDAISSRIASLKPMLMPQ